MTTKILTMKDLEGKFGRKRDVQNLVDACINDLKKFYNCRPYLNTPVNQGRRDGPLASNILNSYPPRIIAKAFKQLPDVLKVNKGDRIRVVSGFE